jgi:hypothetical protein
MIAALYIDPRGPYPRMPDVDCWDESRDARLYDGPHPVVAHPPCGPWSNLRHLHRGEGKDCGPIAVEQVRRWGGVVEQPAGSKLFAHCGIAIPGEAQRVDEWRGFSVVVDQCAWGHVARKRTWLYFVEVDLMRVLETIRYGGAVTHWCSGGRSHSRKGSGGFAPPGIKICSAQQRRRTPPAFAAWLAALAGTAWK